MGKVAIGDSMVDMTAYYNEKKFYVAFLDCVVCVKKVL